jgi:hypothetical protein
MSLSGKLIHSSSFILAIACSLGCFACGDCVETPSIASITPTSATAGSASLVLVVKGDHFQHDSTVEWNNTNLSTTFVSENQLEATIAAEDLVTAARVRVTVFSPPETPAATFEANTTSSATSSVKIDCGGGTSNVLNFAVEP